MGASGKAAHMHLMLSPAFHTAGDLIRLDSETLPAVESLSIHGRLSPALQVQGQGSSSAAGSGAGPEHPTSSNRVDAPWVTFNSITQGSALQNAIIEARAVLMGSGKDLPTPPPSVPSPPSSVRSSTGGNALPGPPTPLPGQHPGLTRGSGVVVLGSSGSPGSANSPFATCAAMQQVADVCGPASTSNTASISSNTGPVLLGETSGQGGQSSPAHQFLAPTGSFALSGGMHSPGRAGMSPTGTPQGQAGKGGAPWPAQPPVFHPTHQQLPPGLPSQLQGLHSAAQPSQHPSHFHHMSFSSQSSGNSGVGVAPLPALQGQQQVKDWVGMGCKQICGRGPCCEQGAGCPDCCKGQRSCWQGALPRIHVLCCAQVCLVVIVPC